MPSKVEKTMLVSLFSDGSSSILPHRVKIYELMKDRIFPDIKSYVLFLSTSDFNEKLELARALIGRLCLDSNYPPPFNLLSDLAKQEEETANRSLNSNYIAQDHFTPILTMYILGVYIYFCHPTLNASITSLFQDKRTSEKNPNRVLSATKDFISSWKYFCLFHDISYPIEFRYKHISPNPSNEEHYFPGTERIRKEHLQITALSSNELKGMYAYNSLSSEIDKEQVVEILTKLVVLYELVTDPSNISWERTVSNLPHCFENLSTKQCMTAEELAHKFKDLICIDKIFSFEHLKMFLGFVSKYEIIASAFDPISETPYAIMFYEFDGSNYNKEIYVASGFHQNQLDASKINNLFDEEAASDSEKELRYYFNKPKDALLAILPQKKGNATRFFITEDDLAFLSTTITGERKQSVFPRVSLDLLHITNQGDLGDYIFQTNIALRKLCKEKIDYDKWHGICVKNYAECMLNNARTSYKNYLSNDLQKDIIKSIEKSLKVDAKSQTILSLTEALLLNKTEAERSKLINDFIEDIYSEVRISNARRDAKKTIIDIINESVLKDIQTRNKLVRMVFTAACDQGIDCSKRDNDEIWVQQNSFDHNRLITLLASNLKSPYISAIYEQLNSYIGRKYNLSIKNLLDEYYNVPYYDHGICSSLLYLYVSTLYEKASTGIISNKRDFSRAVCPLVWAVDPEFADRKLRENYDHIIYETFRAILFHNIYAAPFREIFDNRAWNIDVTDNPFTYYCILIDSLQRWGRRRFYDFRSVEYRPDFAMDDYDICIERDTIVLSISAFTPKVDIVKKKMIDDMDEFLKDCSRFLRIKINGVT